MSDVDTEDEAIKGKKDKASSTYGQMPQEFKVCSPFTADTPIYYPTHSYTKFNNFILAAHQAMGEASHNATTTSSAAAQLVVGAQGERANYHLTQYINDVANHVNVIGEYFGTNDAAQAYSLVLQNAKRAIVSIQDTFNKEYDGVLTGASGAKTKHNSVEPGNPCKDVAFSTSCSTCGANGAYSAYKTAYETAQEGATTQVQLVEQAREAMISAVRSLVVGGTGGQAAAQAAQTGQGMMSGMDASMVSGIMSGIGQILQVPASMVSNLASQGAGLASSIASQIASVATQGAGAAPTSAQEKDDVTVVKKQGPKLGEFITNQKKPSMIVSSTPAGGAGAGGSSATPAKPAAKPRVRSTLKVNFDPDAATGWGTTAASADIQGEGHKATVRVPFKAHKN